MAIMSGAGQQLTGRLSVFAQSGETAKYFRRERINSRHILCPLGEVDQPSPLCHVTRIYDNKPFPVPRNVQRRNVCLRGFEDLVVLENYLVVLDSKIPSPAARARARELSASQTRTMKIFHPRPPRHPRSVTHAHDDYY